MPAFLAESGLQLLENKSHDDLQMEFLSEENRQATLAVGENIALVACSNTGNVPLGGDSNANR